MQRYLWLTALVFLLGKGCSISNDLPLREIGTGLEIVSETTAAQAETETGSAGANLKAVSIITNLLSTLAFGLFYWRLRSNLIKEETK